MIVEPWCWNYLNVATKINRTRWIVDSKFSITLFITRIIFKRAITPITDHRAVKCIISTIPHRKSDSISFDDRVCRIFGNNINTIRTYVCTYRFIFTFNTFAISNIVFYPNLSVLGFLIYALRSCERYFRDSKVTFGRGYFRTNSVIFSHMCGNSHFAFYRKYYSIYLISYATFFSLYSFLSNEILFLVFFYIPCLFYLSNYWNWYLFVIFSPFRFYNFFYFPFIRTVYIIFPN